MHTTYNTPYNKYYIYARLINKYIYIYDEYIYMMMNIYIYDDDDYIYICRMGDEL